MTLNDSETQARIRRLLGSEAMRPLVERLDRRLGKNVDLSGSLTVANASDETIDAITGLLGKPPSKSGRLTVRLSDLDEAVAGATGVDLFTAISVLLGRPPTHPATAKRLEQERWQQDRQQWLKECPDLPGKIRSLLASYPTDSELRRVTGSDRKAACQILGRIRDCLIRLPLSSPLPLPVFATETLGDAHALDADQALHRYLREAIEKLWGKLGQADRWRSRDVFARVGIVLDELSSTVLVMNLRPRSGGFVANLLNDAAAVGQPVRITFRMLRQCPLSFDPRHPMVSVCENPSVMASAADALGPESRPLVCVEGFPSHAAIRLIDQLAAAGVTCRYHGDFDPSGIQIAHQMIVGHQMQPWRMGATDYESASSKSNLKFAESQTIAETAWDPDLQCSLQSRRISVLEEMILDELLFDLQRQP